MHDWHFERLVPFDHQGDFRLASRRGPRENLSMRSLRSLFPSLPLFREQGREQGRGQDGDAASPLSSPRGRTREQSLVEKLLRELMPSDLAREIDVWVRRTAPSPAGLARREQAGLELRASTAAAYERVNALLPILAAEVTADRARRANGKRPNVRSASATRGDGAGDEAGRTASPRKAVRSEVAPAPDFAVWSRLVRRETLDPSEDGTPSLEESGFTAAQAAPDLRTLAARLDPEVKATIDAATATISNDSVRSAFEAWMIRVHSGPSPDA